MIQPDLELDTVDAGLLVRGSGKSIDPESVYVRPDMALKLNDLCNRWI